MEHFGLSGLNHEGIEGEKTPRSSADDDCQEAQKDGIAQGFDIVGAPEFLPDERQIALIFLIDETERPQDRPENKAEKEEKAQDPEAEAQEALKRSRSEREQTRRVLLRLEHG